MRETIYIQMQRREGAIVRTLGLIERRGFSVVSIEASPPERSNDLRMQIRVESETRCFETLTVHINRLLDVRHASLRGDNSSALTGSGAVSLNSMR